MFLQSKFHSTFKQRLTFHQSFFKHQLRLRFLFSYPSPNHHLTYSPFIPSLRTPSDIYHVSRQGINVRDSLHRSLIPEAITDPHHRDQTKQSSHTSTATTLLRACPYHTQVLIMGSNGHKKDLKPMDRFLAEGPADQSALFIRSDTGELSTNKGCTCRMDYGST
jgi:hypothetical protein